MNNGNRILVVAPWGKYQEWGEAKYVLEGVEVSSKSSISAIIEAESDKGELHALVLVPETLVPREDLEKCDSTDCYRQALNKLKDEAEKFISTLPGSEVVDKVLIMPNIGRYSGIKWIIGSSDDIISYYAAWAAAGILKRALELGGIDKLVIDLTHGINFMGLAARRASLLVGRLLAAMYQKPIGLVIYNSEPYSREADQLSVHIVQEDVVRPQSSAARLIYSYYYRERAASSLDKALLTDKTPEYARIIGREKKG